MAIVLERVRKGNYVKITEGDYAWESGLFYLPVKDFAQALEEKFSIELPKSELFLCNLYLV